jgi:aryl-alcohol dehydrogenase-like predicted oxidoreductase
MGQLKIGVYVCNCGTNISHTVDADEVTQSVSKLPDVAIARSYRYMCSNPGQEMIIKDIQELGLNRVVCEQPPYNLLDRRPERELIPMALAYGLALIPWSPLAGGFLTGKYRSSFRWRISYHREFSNHILR